MNWERSTSRLHIVTLLTYLCAEYIMQNARLDEAQDGIKIAGRNTKTSDMQIAYLHMPYGRKQKGTEEPLDESERGE